MILKRDEIRTLAGIAIGFPAVVGTGWWLCGALVVVPALTVIFVALMAVVLGGVRRLRGEIQESLRQTQALLYLNTHLDTPHPLPALGGTALLPDSAALLVGLIKEQRPGLILELGSGVSTLVCAQTLKQLGAGQIISVDHSEQFADLTRQSLRRHGLEAWSEVLYAPLEPVEIDGRTWRWYATSQLETEQLIDLLIVDGPPKGVQHLARYPAAHLLFSRLAPDCRIVMDDTNRRDEREIVRRWREELEGFDVQEIPFGKGATIFERSAWTWSAEPTQRFSLAAVT